MIPLVLGHAILDALALKDCIGIGNFAQILTRPTDRGSPLLRVHLPRHHVLSLLIFGSRPCPWNHLDYCSSWIRALHVSHRLVGPIWSENLSCALTLNREFCLRHPEVRDVCDIGQVLFWNSKAAWWATAVMFILNNTFIQGLHVLVISRYINTMMNSHTVCTVALGVVGAVISWLCSLPRTFNTLAKLATVSAFFTFISVLLAAIFAGVEDHPAGYNPDPNHINENGVKLGGEPIVLIIPAAGTTFVAGVNAMLNISYTFIGQITLPSFIAEMKNPYDFRKALWIVTIAEIIVFSLVGAGKVQPILNSSIGF